MLYLATNNGIVCAERKEEWQVIGSALAGHSVTSVAARRNLVLAGTMKGIFRSEDGGGNWSPAKVGPTIQHLRWIDMGGDESSGALAGTEPASIFHSKDRGGARRPLAIGLGPGHCCSFEHPCMNQQSTIQYKIYNTMFRIDKVQL